MRDTQHQDVDAVGEDRSQLLLKTQCAMMLD